MLLPSGQPCGGGLVGDDEGVVGKGVVGKNGKTCRGSLGNVIRQVLWQVLKLNLEVKWVGN